MKTIKEVSQLAGVRPLEFSVFDTKKIDEYARQAKEAYGQKPIR